MNARALGVGLAALALSGCYLSHELGGDGGAESDSASGPSGRCPTGNPLQITIEPPLDFALMGPVTFQGLEADPAIDGVRLHVGLCSSGPSCDHDVWIGGIGTDVARMLSIPDGWTGSGQLSWNGSTVGPLHLHVSDLRRCAACGGSLEMIAGVLQRSSGAPVPTDLLRLDLGRETCRVDACSHHRGIVATANGTTVEAAEGRTARRGPLLLRLTSDYLDTSACAGPPSLPASGLAVSTAGIP